jgi:hypothetical protein
LSLPYLQPYFGLSNSLQTAQAAGGAGGAVGGWVELARTTLGSANSNVTVSSLPDKRYYMALWDMTGRGAVTTDGKMRVGTAGVDTGSNCSHRYSRIGAGDLTNTSTQFIGDISTPSRNPYFGVNYYSNLSGKEKLMISNHIHQQGTGAGIVPNRQENVGKYANTSNPLETINIYTGGANTWNTGSEVVVLGWDPADTHTSNFWEELASVDLSGGANANLSTGTFTAKKYLWVQVFTEASSAVLHNITFNNDTGSNYSRRNSQNGGAEQTDSSASQIQMWVANTGTWFWNMFIVNNASNEKLAVIHNSELSAAGAGTAPNRIDGVAKWANTSAQITEIDFTTTTNTFGTNSIIKVFGSD